MISSVQNMMSSENNSNAHSTIVSVSGHQSAKRLIDNAQETFKINQNHRPTMHLILLDWKAVLVN
ncbi:MAG: hypothetical protein WA421_14360 [Nitrososphaeraceae archaeon]